MEPSCRELGSQSHINHESADVNNILQIFPCNEQYLSYDHHDITKCMTNNMIWPTVWNLFAPERV